MSFEKETLQLDETSAMNYYPDFLTQNESNELFQYLVSLPWKTVVRRNAKGEDVELPRLQLWMADDGVKAQLFQKGPALPWSGLIWRIKDKLEQLFDGYKFDYVLMNYYRDGNDWITFHRDDEAIPSDKNIVASLSFGATRTFQIIPARGRKNTKYEYKLTHGSLVVMRGDMQKSWKHGVPKEPDVGSVRINLTFRKS